VRRISCLKNSRFAFEKLKECKGCTWQIGRDHQGQDQKDERSHSGAGVRITEKINKHNRRKAEA
jgi:hypothetical protein